MQTLEQPRYNYAYILNRDLQALSMLLLVPPARIAKHQWVLCSLFSRPGCGDFLELQTGTSGSSSSAMAAGPLRSHWVWFGPVVGVCPTPNGPFHQPVVIPHCREPVLLSQKASRGHRTEVGHDRLSVHRARRWQLHGFSNGVNLGKQGPMLPTRGAIYPCKVA